MRRYLKTTPEEFVQKLLELKSTKALAEHYNVAPETIANYRCRLRRQGVKLPKRMLYSRRKDIDPDMVAKLNEQLAEYTATAAT